MDLMISGHDGEPVVIREDIEEYDLHNPLAVVDVVRGIITEVDMQRRLKGEEPPKRCEGCLKVLVEREAICERCGRLVPHGSSAPEEAANPPS